MDVQLVYALADQPSVENNYQISVFAQILVKNLSYHKFVALHDDSNADYGATFLKSEINNYEIWTICKDYSGTSLFIKFALKYETLGPYWQFWDNNDGHDYELEIHYRGAGLPVDVAIGAAVLCWSAQIVGQGSATALQGIIALHNYAFQKLVSIRYSLDNWHTYQDVYAKYDPTITNHNIKNGEFWSFNIPLNNTIQRVSFAIRYIVDREEYWDNNIGYNYNITRQHSLSRE